MPLTSTELPYLVHPSNAQYIRVLFLYCICLSFFLSVCLCHYVSFWFVSIYDSFSGADAQFVMSLPHGALYFYIIEGVQDLFSKNIPKKFSFLHDFVCSSVSTMVCSVVSTPQMVLADRLMADIYPSFPVAVQTIFKKEGLQGFYSGWWPVRVQHRYH